MLLTGEMAAESDCRVSETAAPLSGAELSSTTLKVRVPVAVPAGHSSLSVHMLVMRVTVLAVTLHAWVTEWTPGLPDTW